MASKKTFSMTKRHTIYYQYDCGHCGKNSGILTHDFVGKKEITRTVGFTEPKMSIEIEYELDEGVREDLAEQIDTAKIEVCVGEYSAKIFNGKCPHCQKYQSWSGGSFVNYVAKQAWSLTMLMLWFTFVIPLFLSQIDKNYAGVFGGYVLVLAGVFAGTLIYRGYRWWMMKHDGSKVVNRTFPTIDWNE